MRIKHIATWVAVALAGLAIPAASQTVPTNSYDVSFEPISDTCSSSATFKRATVTAKISDKDVELSVPTVPAMSGALRSDRFRIKASARGDNAPRYSASGTVTETRLEFVLVIEQFHDGKPTCSQSVRGTGARK